MHKVLVLLSHLCNSKEDVVASDRWLVHSVHSVHMHTQCVFVVHFHDNNTHRSLCCEHGGSAMALFIDIRSSEPTHMADWLAGLPANHEVPSSRPALVAGSV